MTLENILSEKNRTFIFITDLNYADLDNGYGLLTSHLSNSWLVENINTVKKIYEYAMQRKSLSYDDYKVIGTELIDKMYDEGMVGISDEEELFSDLHEFNISDEPRKNDKFSLFILHVANECNLSCRYCFADADTI